MSINIKQHVYELLATYNREQADQFAKMTPDPFDNEGEVEQLRRMYVFWHVQLGLLPIDVSNVREYLEVDVPFQVWFERFKRFVLPTILEHRVLL